MAGLVVRIQQWGRGGWVVFALVAVTAVIAVPVALSAAGVKDSWWAGVAAGVAALVTPFGKIIAERLRRLVSRRDEGDLSVIDGCLVTTRGSLPRVRQIADPRRLGVHPAAQLDSADHGDAAEAMPPYVPRDVDDRVRAGIARGGFVLLVGDSTAGKTRTAFEAVTATVPDHVLVAPKDRAAVKSALERAMRAGNCVVWLNDVEHHLGPSGLTRELLSRLLSGPRHVVVVGTIRASERARFAEGGGLDEATRELFRTAREALALVDDEIRVERFLSSAESERAADRAWDRRIADAIDHGGEYGLAEYLAAGPELVRAWHNGWDVGAHPRGAALVAAAVDARRAGLEPPLSGRLLEELADGYLLRRGGDRLRPEPWGDAWEWALRARRATTSLMMGSAKAGYDVFDYLVDAAQRDSCPERYVPEATLRAALDISDGSEAMAIGVVSSQQGFYALALDALSRATQRLTSDHGAEHPYTLASRAGLATALHEMGRFEKAEHEIRAVLEIRERSLGADHVDTLGSRNNLACVLCDRGQFDEAERAHLATLEALRRLFGPESEYTLTVQGNLAVVHERQGRLEEAEREHRATLDGVVRLFGADHPETFGNRDNLARVLCGRGRWEEAAQEHRAVLELRVRTLGAEHPATLTSRSNLALPLSRLERWDEAEREDRVTLEARRRVLGPEHPDTLTSRSNLTGVLCRLGRHEEAESEHRAVLEVRVRALGADHPDALLSRSKLAIELSHLGRLEEAEQAHRAVLDARVRVLGAEHPDTLVTRNNLAVVLFDLGRLEEAERGHRTVLDGLTRLLGPEHPDTRYSQTNLAATLKGLGRLDEAAREARAGLEVCARVLGPDHPDTLFHRTLIAATLRDSGRMAEAEHEYSGLVAAQTRVLGPDHPDTLISRANRAIVLGELGRWAEAEREHRAVLELRDRILGPADRSTLTSRYYLAKAVGKLGRLDEAEREHRAELEVCSRVLGPDHLDTLKSRDALIGVLCELEWLEEAEREYRSAIEARVRVLGPTSRDTVACRINRAAILIELGRHEEAEREHRLVRAICARIVGSDYKAVLSGPDGLSIFLSRLEEADRERAGAGRTTSGQSTHGLPPGS